MEENELKTLQKKLGYKFRKPGLLKNALRHTSYANENRNSGVSSNERLEFLGDSVLGMTVADLIFRSKPDMPEGQMTRLRAELVCEKSLAAFAVSFDLGEYLQLGHGEEKTGGRKRPSILADAMEAVIAAMYLDGGFKPVENLILKRLAPQVGMTDVANTDYKTSLQEVIQEKAGQTLSYHVIGESGPDHMKLFTVEVRLNGAVLGHGAGKSKKEAEQSAARAALDEL